MLTEQIYLTLNLELKFTILIGKKNHFRHI